MFSVKPEKIGHYPYFLSHTGPVPLPVWHASFLDPAKPREYYLAKAEAAPGRVSYLVLGRGEAISYRQGHRPEADTVPPGVFRIGIVQWCLNTDPNSLKIPHPVSYTHLTLPTIYSV